MDDTLVVSDLQVAHHAQLGVLLAHPFQFDTVFLKESFFSRVSWHLGSSISVSSVAKPFATAGLLSRLTIGRSRNLTLVLGLKLLSRGDGNLSTRVLSESIFEVSVLKLEQLNLFPLIENDLLLLVHLDYRFVFNVHSTAGVVKCR